MKLIGDRRHQPRATHAKRVTGGDGAAVRIHMGRLIGQGRNKVVGEDAGILVGAT